MMKDVRLQQQQEQHLVEENMSNLTSASGEASASSGNKADVATSTNYTQQYCTSSQTQTQSVKKKRSLPGNPDPDAEVIALSPRTLLATNRFICEICNKGFQRDQNLQLHRRGHNLPWKLKHRTSKEIRKKVYVCPEPTCVHHDPSRALGDLTGIKKHFCRKHWEKKWKCDKCSKRYAVQSDWKAHSKTCGTREYRCDCGTLFSRRDSFITHGAFCDALAEESARAITANPVLPSQPSAGSSASHLNSIHVQQPSEFNPQELHAFSLKKEPQNFDLIRPEMPPWLAFPVGPRTTDLSSSSSSSIFSTRLDHHQELTPSHHQRQHLYGNSNSNSTPLISIPNPNSGPTHSAAYQAAAPSPHLSATALLQKAAQMGSNMSKTGSSEGMVRPHTEAHVCVDMRNNTTGSGSCFGLKLSSREEQTQMASAFAHSLAPFGNKAAAVPCAIAGNTATSVANSTAAASFSSINVNPSFLQGMMNSLSSGNITTPSFERTNSYEDAFCGILNTNKDGCAKDVSLTKTSYLNRSDDHEVGAKNGGHVNDSLTRDFLGLKPLSHCDIFSIAGLGDCMGDSHVDQQITQSQKQWQG